MKKIVDVCARRAIIYPTAEIYGGSAGFYELGPIGFKIAQKIIEYWRDVFVRDTEHVYEIMGRTILPEAVFAASGHLEGFTDPMVQCKKCKSIYRADHLVSEVKGESFEGKELAEYDQAIKELEISCPKCKSREWEPTRYFNLMFSTEIGAVGGNMGYLRPETAQNIFIAFRRISYNMRAKLPFGIAQVGPSYRNEIAPRNFVLRSREFTQMEIEMFSAPDELNQFPQFIEVEDVMLPLVTRQMQEKGEFKPLELSAREAVEKGYIPNQVMAYFMALERLMMDSFGISDFWFREMREDETPHYSGGNLDLEVQLSIGPLEIIGNAYRTDYDLKKHSKASGTKLQITHNGGTVVPHTVEPSIGLERVLYAALEKNYRDKGHDRGWSWFAFPPVIAPYSLAVFPLIKKDDAQLSLAQDIYRDLHEEGYDVFYDDSGKIGKRYARADEIGIPYCITVDHDTVESNKVTIRDRDSMKQAVVPLELLSDVLEELIVQATSFTEVIQQFELNLVESSS